MLLVTLTCPYTWMSLDEGSGVILDERQSAILKFAAKLSKSPPQATREDGEALQKAGLSAAEILDLILSASLFGWANRLMHTLGEPIVK